jgi:hypothetical protein
MGVGVLTVDVFEVPTVDVFDVPTVDVFEVPTVDVFEVPTVDVFEVPTVDVFEVPTVDVFEVPTVDVFEVPTVDVFTLEWGRQFPQVGAQALLVDSASATAPATQILEMCVMRCLPKAAGSPYTSPAQIFHERGY